VSAISVEVVTPGES